MSLVIDGDDVRGAMESGFNFVCAFCVKLHAGKESAGTDWDKTNCIGNRCWGPMGGNNYPEYQGPLGDNLTLFCFRCGKPEPEHAVASVHDPGRKIGCCKEHLDLLKQVYQTTHKKKMKPNGVNQKLPVLVDGGMLV